MKSDARAIIRPPTTLRSCGTCSLCCKLYEISELNKPARVWCRHCRPRQGGLLDLPGAPIALRQVRLPLAHWPARRRVAATTVEDRGQIILGFEARPSDFRISRRHKLSEPMARGAVLQSDKTAQRRRLEPSRTGDVHGPGRRRRGQFFSSFRPGTSSDDNSPMQRRKGELR
jgi:hypothetical protein